MRGWTLLLVGIGLVACRPPVATTAPARPEDPEQHWKTSPPLEHEAFWKNEALIVTSPTNGRIQVALLPVFLDKTSAQPIAALPARDYKAIPLDAYLASRPEAEVGTGEHLVITNMRGERLYLTRAELLERKPVLVIGLDDERNLYRLASAYQLKRAYSWRPETPPAMIRPVGPFLFFPEGAPPDLNDLAAFGLTPRSFRFVKDDPLAVVLGLSPELRDTLAGRDGCLHCHSFRGAGARASHVRASDGKPDGGIALPLDQYTPDVLRRFLFEQEAVAASFGVDALPLPAPAATALYELVTRK